MTEQNKSNLNPSNWVDKYGDYLYNYALFRVSDRSVAEDLTQETFLSALKNIQSFSENSSLKTWLTAILKNKIIDYYRKVAKSNQKEDEQILFNETEEIYYKEGRWKDFWNVNRDPLQWEETPLSNLEKKEFWDAFHKCLNELPENFKAIFTLREMEDIPTDKICKELNLTSSNIWVILHRSRKQLRRCLEINWYGGKIFPRMKT